ncbi:aminoglycoside phosphotransferase family protein [Clostridium estertheticum]|uniref:aminoglycoside phosphotransferase family protein n=1 Tax=Clostridium estertheticum TaxID=238834 RepID=UPI0014793D35|nr:aminoglycoside phosphotransferase family protein [Clostridium estertheticum]MBZ9618251.1 aminoglycoside phosphotransferase family protein [Clostridium estertheticum subsp. laramiense]WAG76247.1 aminoglycoside phosphotransferase family protein [Clostridium estertheticum]
MNNKINIFEIEKIFKKINNKYKVISVENIDEGRINKLYKVTAKINEYYKFILKVRSFENKNFKQGFAIEQYINPLLREIKVYNSPNLYLSDISHKEFNFDYSILEFIEGKTLDNFNNKNLFFNSGRLLAKIHSIKSNYLGKITEDKLNISQVNFYYTNYFNKVINDLSYYDQFLSNKINLFVKLNFDVYYYKDLNPVLIHNDFHMKNIIVSEDNKLNIIDWDCARYAHSELEFIKFKHLSPSRNDINPFINLIKGYQTIKELELTPNFFIHELIWFARMYTFEKNNILKNYEYFPSINYYRNKIIEYCNKKSVYYLYKELCYELQ